MSAMLGVIETSLQGSSMRVLQSEDADPWTGPNIVFVTQTAAERPNPEGSPESRRSRSVATFATVQRRRDLTWRFEAKLRCQPVVKVWRRTETGEAPRGQGATTEKTASI